VSYKEHREGFVSTEPTYPDGGPGWGSQEVSEGRPVEGRRKRGGAISTVDEGSEEERTRKHFSGGATLPLSDTSKGRRARRAGGQKPGSVNDVKTEWELGWKEPRAKTRRSVTTFKQAENAGLVYGGNVGQQKGWEGIAHSVPAG